MPLRFLDTTVLLRYLTRDDERKAAAALALLQRIERGEEWVVTTQAVIFETVFTLQRFYKVPRERIRDLVLPIVTLCGVQLPNKPLYERAIFPVRREPHLPPRRLEGGLHGRTGAERDLHLGYGFRRDRGHHAHRARVVRVAQDEQEVSTDATALRPVRA